MTKEEFEQIEEDKIKRKKAEDAGNTVLGFKVLSCAVRRGAKQRKRRFNLLQSIVNWHVFGRCSITSLRGIFRCGIPSARWGQRPYRKIMSIPVCLPMMSR